MADENVFLLYALVMGVFITFVYDILRIFRRVVPHKNLLVSLEDLGFWAFCAARVFLLMYQESNGTLRWFAVLGALVGMELYKKLISGIFVKYTALLLNTILGFLGKIIAFVCRPFLAAGRGAGRVLGRAAGRVSTGKKSIQNKCRNQLTGFLKMLKMVIHKQ